jgi:hypothetical protein
MLEFQHFMLKKDLIKISLLCKVLLKEEGTRKGVKGGPKIG